MEIKLGDFGIAKRLKKADDTYRTDTYAGSELSMGKEMN
jgi:hypothetical protein